MSAFACTRSVPDCIVVIEHCNVAECWHWRSRLKGSLMFPSIESWLAYEEKMRSLCDLTWFESVL